MARDGVTHMVRAARRRGVHRVNRGEFVRQSYQERCGFLQATRRQRAVLMPLNESAAVPFCFGMTDKEEVHGLGIEINLTLFIIDICNVQIIKK